MKFKEMLKQKYTDDKANKPKKFNASDLKQEQSDSDAQQEFLAKAAREGSLPDSVISDSQKKLLQRRLKEKRMKNALKSTRR